MNLKEELVIGSFNDLSKWIDKSFYELLIFLKELGIIHEEKIKRSFKDKNELTSFIKEIISNYLNEKYLSLHEEISEIRKKGVDLTEVSLKLSMFKSKLRIFKASLNKTSFNKVILILQKVEGELKKYKEEKEKQIPEKTKTVVENSQKENIS